ncbi:Plasmodium exported protein, unknown function [Plasmodium gonderi]|uniref:Peptidase M3A/M3B catalytic domain-containing protein n=1 Tax=Plasmodium gonderi TaxID=77519 RepID=A0A1Y1JDZ6_PLAGO|nr:Plasmodium exported protein, unknown function [Plasmodium gonderi]GAW80480.1 Plasmodium exported protein, unknown function [Plasmodium gonderi]
MNKRINFLINKWIFVFFSKISPILCSVEERKLREEIVEHVKNSKIISYPIDKKCINFFFTSKEIHKLISITRTVETTNEKRKNQIIVQNCLNLYYFLITCAKLKKISYFQRRALEYIEENIAKHIHNIGVETVDRKFIPYTIHIKNEKSVSTLVGELSMDCSNYLRKINGVKIRYLTIGRHEISIDEDWKKKHECTFDKKKLRIPISKHNYEFILNGINESSLREKVLDLLNSPYKKGNLNKDIINILKKRYDIATKLGYKNWVQYSMSHFTSEKDKYNKLKDFFNVVKEKVDGDYERINANIVKMAYSKACIGNAQLGREADRGNKLCKDLSKGKLFMHDWSYYYNKIMNKSDEYFVNTFFPHAHIWKNFIRIISRIYNFSYEMVEDKEVLRKWPKGSLIYRINLKDSNNNDKVWGSISSRTTPLLTRIPLGVENYRKELEGDVKLLGYMYIIPYMDIKLMDYFKVPSMNCLSNTCLICKGHVVLDYKFIGTMPIDKKLFSSSEILTIFHEFGHAYHLLLLSRRYSLYQFSNMPLDYAEFFSHMNEHLANNYSVLYNLSNKVDDNSKINEHIFKSIKFDSSRLANIYTHSVIDYEIHDLNPYNLFFSNSLENNKKDISEDNSLLLPFYDIIEKYFPYKISSTYSIHSTSFPYHFSCYYAGSVLSYLLAEIRVLMNMSIDDLSIKKNSSLVAFQKKFYTIVQDDIVNASVIDHALANKQLLVSR